MSEWLHSPFVVFDHGTPIYPPNDLHQRTAEIMDGLKAFTPQAAVAELLKARPLLPFSWHPAIAHMFQNYYQQGKDCHGMEERLLSLISLMLKQPALAAWHALRDELVSQIDAYSGWSFSWRKDLAKKDKISRGPDGFYYAELEDGTVVRLHGAKMSTEVRLDYIHDQVLRPYGRVRQIIDTFSLFAVSVDFQEHPDAYPSSLRMVLADKTWYRGRFPWHLMDHRLMRTSRWRPYSNHCDPDWLSEDLIARIVTASGSGVWGGMVNRFKDRPSQQPLGTVRPVLRLFPTSLSPEWMHKIWTYPNDGMAMELNLFGDWYTVSLTSNHTSTSSELKSWTGPPPPNTWLICDTFQRYEIN